MFSIPSSDGHAKQSQTIRRALTCAYVLYTLAGIGLLFSPVVVEVYGNAAWVYSGFLALGGICSTLGAYTRRWLGEFVGLPLLISAFAAYGLEIYGGSYRDAPFLAVSNAMFLWGMAVLSFARWRVSLAAYRLVHNLARDEKEGRR